MILQVDGGGLIFAAMFIFAFLAFLAWFGLNRAVIELRVEISRLRDEVKHKRIYETDRFLDRNRVSAGEIIGANAAGRIGLWNEFVSIDNLSRKQITGNDPLEPVLSNETTQPFNHSQVLQIGISADGAAVGARNAASGMGIDLKPSDSLVAEFCETMDELKSSIENRTNKSAEFEKGNRQPISEILSEIYDEQEK